MSKPNKCRVMCPDIGRQKMLFETEEKAKGFIKFNGEELTDDISKLRVYWCDACGGYHISSHKLKKSDDGRRTKNLIKAYKKDLKEGSKFDKLDGALEAGKYFPQIPKEVTNNEELKRWFRSLNIKNPRVINSFYEMVYKNRPELKHN